MSTTTQSHTQDEALCFRSAIDLAAAIRARDVSPVEIVGAVLRRIEALNPRLNAFCFVHADEALAQARAAEAAVMRDDSLGPLHGVPVSIKDNVAAAGKPMTSGSRLLKDNVAREDSPIAARIAASGAIVVGRTNTPEFAWRGSTDNRLFGETHNPWDLSRTAGGSSGGAGAAVAAGLAPLAIGTDGAGSIRIPASFCGIVGHKPSFGRVPFFPSPGANELAAHAGPMTRTVRDAAFFLDVLAGPDECDRFSLPATDERFLDSVEGGVAGWRIAWSPDLGHIPVDPEVRQIAEGAARAFADLGAHVDSPDLGLPDPAPILDVLYPSVQASSHHLRSDAEKAQMDPGLVEIARRGAQYSSVDVGRAMVARSAYWDRMRRAFEQIDVLVTPTISVPAFEGGIIGPDAVDGRPVVHLGWTLAYPYNLTGQPAITVPCGFTMSGLPVGLQIVGRRFADGAVLRAAAAFEEVRPWADRRPPL
ncbi:MAG: amidase [Chloroflexi bacterium]|nr:amidase [Chloroflexota bacterium]